MNSSDRQCPNCGHKGFVRADQTVTLRRNLEEWQIQAPLTFPDAVWRDYADVLDKELTLHRCPECQFRQFVPPLAGTSSFYAAIAGEGANYYTQERWEFRKAIGDIAAQKAQSVLDAGCGGGAFLKQLTDSGTYDAYGFDFNPHTADALASIGLKSIERMDVRPRPGGFDAVTCMQVLEHLEDPWSFGQSLRDQLRPGGLLILTTPDADGPIRHFTGSVTDLPPHHVSRWNAASIEAFGRRFGFQLIKIRREPLSSYIWRFYLPVMIRKSGIPEFLKTQLLKSGRVERFLSLLESRGIRELPPLPGHTLYATFRG